MDMGRDELELLDIEWKDDYDDFLVRYYAIVYGEEKSNDSWWINQEIKEPRERGSRKNKGSDV